MPLTCMLSDIPYSKDKENIIFEKKMDFLSKGQTHSSAFTQNLSTVVQPWPF